MAEVHGVYRINDDGWHVSIRKNPAQEYVRLYAAHGEITDEEMALAHRIAAVGDMLEALRLIRGNSCECYTTPKYGACILNKPNGRGAKYEADAWCNSCVAHVAITKAEGKS